MVYLFLNNLSFGFINLTNKFKFIGSNLIDIFSKFKDIFKFSLFISDFIILLNLSVS